MGKQVIEQAGVSRRNFIKGAAAVTAAGALSGSVLYGCQSQGEGDTSTGDAVATTQIFSGACRGNCAGGCFLDIHVRDGKVVRTTARDLPEPQYNRICTRGITQPGRVYSAERIQYPMRRVGERGAGEFERITWDEAIDEITKKWMAYSDEFGPASVAMNTGSGNYAVCDGVAFASASGRFTNVVGASTIPLNVDAAVGLSFAHTGNTMYGQNNEPLDYINSKTIICWGASPTISQPQIMHFILEAKDAGAKYIVIDPAYNANTSKADMHIAVHPSTDGALAFGVCNEILAQGWQNLDFLRASTEAPFLIKEDGTLLRMSDVGVAPTEGDVDPTTGKPAVIDPFAVWDESQSKAVAAGETKVPALENISEVNGLKVKTQYDLLKEKVAEYPLERASELSGVPVETIKELARVYAQEGPVNTYSMFGSNHYINGHYNYWPIYAVSLLTANSGRSGAAFGFSELMPLIANFAGTGFPVDSAGNPAQGAGTTYVINKIPEVLETKTFAGKPAILKAVYVACTNPMSTMAEREKTKNWMSNVEFLVVADSSMTETATFADIVLPVSHWFEMTDLFTSFGTNPYIMWQEQAIEPLFESKRDFEIYKLLAEKMGYGEFFDLTPEDYIALWLDSDACKAMGITYDRMKEEKAIKILPGDPFISFEGGVFLTDTGRAKFYEEKVPQNYNVGQTIDESKERTLYWEPALEADVNSPIRQTHPFMVLSEHMRTRTHSQWWDVDYLKEYEAEPIVKISPEDAAEYGIKDGDNLRLFNDRGSVVMKAITQPGLPSRMLACPRSFQAQEFIEGHFASISTNQFNQVCANQSFNDVAVSIEKA